MTTEMKVRLCNLRVYNMFSSMFSSMFGSMFTRDRGFIFFRTSIWNSKNIFGKFSSSPSLTALELKGVSLHVLQYRRVTWVTCPQRRLVKTIWVIHKYIIYVIILICISFFPLMSRTNFPEVFYTNNSYGNSRNPFRRSLSVCSRSGRRRADARVRLTLAHSRSSRYRGGVLKRHERSVCAKIAWASHRSRSSAVNTVVNVSGIEICRGMFTGGKTAWRGTDSRRLRARPAGPFTRLRGKRLERRSERYDGRAKDARRKACFFHFSGKKLIQISSLSYSA